MKKIFFFFLLCLGIGQIVQATDLQVTLNYIYNITQTTASADATLQSYSSEYYTYTYGVCYSSTNATPSTSDTKTSSSVYTGGTGRNSAQTISMTGLTVNTTYYVRAYATSAALGKTFYSSVDTLKTPPYVSRALKFNGTTDYVAIPNNSLLDLTTNYTITAWIKPAICSQFAGIVSKRHTGTSILQGGVPAYPSSKGYVLRLAGNSPYKGLDFDGEYTSNYTNLLTINSWYHVVAVYNGSTRTIYVNGNSVSVTSTGDVATTTDSVKIGADNGNFFPPNTHYFNGTIDEVSIWNKALSQSEITSGMNNGFTGNETGLVTYYKFDQGTPSGTNTSITTLNDASTNGLTGYLRHMALTGSSSNFVTGVYLGSTVINKTISTLYVDYLTDVAIYMLYGSVYMQSDNTNSTSESHKCSYGMCWSSTNSMPTIANSTYYENNTKYTTGNGNISDLFQVNTNSKGALTAGTTYYARAYCTIDNATTYYGDVLTFETYGTPTVATSAVSSVGTTTVTGNGNITYLGNPASVSDYGICWSSTATTPSLSDSHVSNGTKTTTGAFTSSMTGLTPGVKYYVRAYATNYMGTAYGSVVSFTTTGIAPTSISYPTPNTFYVDTAITALSPTIVGGTAITSYTISPNLPGGLSFNSSTGIISGTPTAESSATNYTVTGSNTGGSVSAVVNIRILSIKQLSVKAYLEGFWNNATANMDQCKNTTGTAVFTSAVDTVTVELHSSSSYSNIAYSIHGYIGQDGNIYSGSLTYLKMPSNYSDSYYITVKTRNHLATTTASAVSFAGSSISYDFTTDANKAYGSNMKQLASGVYGCYAGDVNQDGTINSVDDNTVNTLSKNFTTGYRPEDINGDGLVDTSDVSIVDRNMNSSVSVSHP
ncbi:MAG: sialidase domain-containing protein [Paludibacteraceae bacterium]|nr:sialidase domain-containing protein [Paludibacteraceae bacterium]